MGEPQIVINKTWGEHLQDEKINRLRRQRIFTIVLTVVIFLAILLWGYVNLSSENFNYLFIVVIIIAVLIIFKRQIFRRKHKPKSKSGWEKIEPPNWVVKRMKRKKKNRVHGKHYRYKKENGKYYRKR